MSNLQQKRKAAGLTQEELSSMVEGLSLRSVQAYESGFRSINRATVETVLKIADVLHCDPHDLLD